MFFIVYWRLCDRSTVVSGYVKASNAEDAYKIVKSVVSPGCEIIRVCYPGRDPVPSDCCVNFSCFWEDVNHVGFL